MAVVEPVNVADLPLQNMRSRGRVRFRADALAAGVLALGVWLVILPWPAVADAHGLLGRAFLPVPTWLFAWAAGIVLVLSFIALRALWSSPRLERAVPRRLFGVPSFLEPLCGAVGVAAFVVVVLCGLGGTQVPTSNLAPTAVFVLFWVGVPVLSVVAGDVFRPFNPWRAVGRAVGWIVGRAGLASRVGDPIAYPQALGRWPATASIVAFAWVELVFVGRSRPSSLAVLAVAYALVQLVGMAAFGVERWTDRGDGFAVAFNLFSRLSPIEYRSCAAWGRPPLSGLTGVCPAPGTVALLCAMIGATTFDGGTNGPLWRAVAAPIERDLARVGLGGTAAVEVTLSVGLVACILLCAGLYWLGIKGMGLVSAEHPSSQLAGAFVYSLVPIAFGYLLAHYFSLLVTQGQAIAHLISDPMGTGADLFGTAGIKINAGFLSAAAIWYVQVAALVGGHMSGLVLAHDRALVVYGDVEEATQSQRWMLVVMVTFTCLGLWLLSAVNT